GPISGVSAGQYLTGFLNDLFHSAHMNIVLPMNSTSAVFGALVTIYFWRLNIKGIPQSSGKALRIMQVTTAMVVMMIVWAGYTIWVRGAHLPPWPSPSHLVFSDQALGWLRHSRLPYTVGFIGVRMGFALWLV